MASLGLTVTRLGMRTLSALSIPLAGRLAYRIFCTTESRIPKGKKQRSAHAEGEAILGAGRPVRLSISTGSVMTTVFGDGLPTHAPRVLVVHGWGSGAAYLAPMAAALHQAGNRVAIIDLPGHGRSSGRTLDMRRAVEAIAAAAREHGPLDAIVAHSFGGAASIIATSGLLPCFPRVKAGRLVVIGAPSRLDFIFSGFARMIGLSRQGLEAVEQQAERGTGLHPASFDGASLVSSLGIETLVLHAEDDKEVPADNASRYENRSARIKVKWMNGLGHRRIVRDAGVFTEIITFIKGEAERAAA